MRINFGLSVRKFSVKPLIYSTLLAITNIVCNNDFPRTQFFGAVGKKMRLFQVFVAVIVSKINRPPLIFRAAPLDRSWFVVKIRLFYFTFGFYSHGAGDEYFTRR